MKNIPGAHDVLRLEPLLVLLLLMAGGSRCDIMSQALWSSYGVMVVAIDET